MGLYGLKENKEYYKPFRAILLIKNGFLIPNWGNSQKWITIQAQLHWFCILSKPIDYFTEYVKIISIQYLWYDIQKTNCKQRISTADSSLNFYEIFKDSERRHERYKNLKNQGFRSFANKIFVNSGGILAKVQWMFGNGKSLVGEERAI